MDVAVRVVEDGSECLDQRDDVPAVAEVGPALDRAGPPAAPVFRRRVETVEDQVGDAERGAEGDQGADGPLRVGGQCFVGDDGAEGVADEDAGVGADGRGDRCLDAGAYVGFREVAADLPQHSEEKAVAGAGEEPAAGQGVECLLREARGGCLGGEVGGEGRHPVGFDPCGLRPPGQQQFDVVRVHGLPGSGSGPPLTAVVPAGLNRLP